MKLGDFGLASRGRASSSSSSSSSSSRMTEMTTASMAGGTPMYAPPEQRMSRNEMKREWGEKWTRWLEEHAGGGGGGRDKGRSRLRGKVKKGCVRPPPPPPLRTARAPCTALDGKNNGWKERGGGRREEGYQAGAPDIYSLGIVFLEMWLPCGTYLIDGAIWTLWCGCERMRLCFSYSLSFSVFYVSLHHPGRNYNIPFCCSDYDHQLTLSYCYFIFWFQVVLKR